MPEIFKTIGCLVLIAVLAACGQSPRYGDVNITTEVEAADGLDLRAVGDLVKEAKDAEDLEKLLNQPEGVNNLDLDANGKVDFVSVTEYGGEKTKGFSLTVEPSNGETQEIATIEIEKSAEGEDAEMYVSGNEQVYGQNHHYHSSHGVGSFLLMAYLFRPHPYYMSPFGYGRYPGYWGGGYGRVARTSYVTRNRGRITGSGATKQSQRTSSVKSPNRGRSASKGVRASMRNPTKSQRAFRAKSGQTARRGGFGRSARGTGRRSATRSRGMGRRSGGFGRGFRSGGFRSRR